MRNLICPGIRSASTRATGGVHDVFMASRFWGGVAGIGAGSWPLGIITVSMEVHAPGFSAFRHRWSEQGHLSRWLGSTESHKLGGVVGRKCLPVSVQGRACEREGGGRGYMLTGAGVRIGLRYHEGGIRSRSESHHCSSSSLLHDGTSHSVIFCSYPRVTRQQSPR